MYSSENAHDGSPGHVVLSGGNGIFVHLPYGSVQSQGGKRCTSSVLKLGGTVAPSTLGVQFPKRACQFTKPCGPVWRNPKFRTTAVWPMGCGCSAPYAYISPYVYGTSRTRIIIIIIMIVMHRSQKEYNEHVLIGYIYNFNAYIN